MLYSETTKEDQGYKYYLLGLKEKIGKNFDKAEYYFTEAIKLDCLDAYFEKLTLSKNAKEILIEESIKGDLLCFKSLSKIYYSNNYNCIEYFKLIKDILGKINEKNEENEKNEVSKEIKAIIDKMNLTLRRLFLNNIRVTRQIDDEPFDFIIKSNGKEYGIHKDVLKGEFFDMLLNGPFSETNEVNMNNYQDRHILMLIEYFYTGCIKEIEMEDISFLFDIADEYMINSLDVLLTQILLSINLNIFRWNY